MGLDTSHDCWSGSYGSFGAWRAKLAEVAGFGDLNSYEGFGGSRQWPQTNDALIVLLNHSDCDGEIAAEYCAPLADRLEGLLPAMEVAGGLHSERTRRFIEGLRVAAEANESVEFF